MFAIKLYNRSLLLSLCCMILIAIFAGGCKKLIDIGDPDNTVTADKVFSIPELANSAMAGIYSQMMSNTGGKVFSNCATTLFAGMSSDELVNFSGTVNELEYQFYINKLYKGNSVVEGSLWQPAYKNIYSANGIIEGIAASTAPQMSDSIRKQLTGEAKFIRAFCFFYLANLFGDVPLTLVTDFNVTTKMKRTPVAEVYKQIEQDLIYAKASLATDFSVSAGERIRPNKWAATALLARVYLYQEKWTEAEAEASEVIGNNKFAIKTNLNDVFLKNSTESIWQLAQNPSVKPYSATLEGEALVPTFRWTQLLPADQADLRAIGNFSIFSPYLVPNFYLSDNAANAFESGDQRRIQWVDSMPAPPESPYNGYVYHYSVKYKESVGTPAAVIAEYYTVLRLAEQYLIRAEARAKQNTNLAGAADDLDVIRKRAGLAKTTATGKDALLAAIAQERRLELMAEWGHRWFDLKRTGKATEVLSIITAKQPWSNDQLLYPIPPLEITNNPAIIQNNGY